MEKLRRSDLQLDLREDLAEPVRDHAPESVDHMAAARLSQVQIREHTPPMSVVQRAPLPGEQTSAPAWTDVAERAMRRSSGAPVDTDIRASVEARVGADLSGARVHTGDHAAEASAAIGARAFTYGRDVFMGAGESAQDRRLMAHELTHVVQQGYGSQPTVQREVVGGAESPAEREADGVADAVVKKPDIEATDEAIGEHVAEGMNKANDGPHTADSGIHYAHNYKRFHPAKWNEDMWKGYADPAFFERLGFMDWRLKPGKSASEGIAKWLNGLTVAECLSTVVALQIDALRAAIGNDKFDEMHGKSGGATPEASRLRIRPGMRGTPVGGLMVETEASEKGEEGAIGGRPAKKGEWYYFYNHPKYLLKHPGGAWQGENALCMGVIGGVQKWSGLGASNVTEDEMMDQMVRAYNAPRTDRDEEVLGWIKKDHGGVLPKEYDPKGGVFEDTTTKEKILAEPEYTIDGTTRKGGFMPSSGMKLDAEAVKRIRG